MRNDGVCSSCRLIVLTLSSNRLWLADGAIEVERGDCGGSDSGFVVVCGETNWDICWVLCCAFTPLCDGVCARVDAWCADEVINYNEEDLKSRIKELTGGKGADVVYDPVGGAYSEAALRGMTYNGRFLVVGFAAGDIPKVPLNLPLLKSCQIVGVFWGTFAQKFPNQNMANSMQLIQWYATGKLKPHIHATYPLQDAPAALEEMMERKVMGKVVVVC